MVGKVIQTIILVDRLPLVVVVQAMELAAQMASVVAISMVELVVASTEPANPQVCFWVLAVVEVVRIAILTFLHTEETVVPVAGWYLSRHGA